MKKFYLAIIVLSQLLCGSVYANSVESNVSVLKKIFKDGRHSTIIANAQTTKEMITQYLYFKYSYMSDSSVYEKYQFVDDAEDFVVDDQVAGTIKSKAVYETVEHYLKEIYGSSSESVRNRRILVAKNILDEIVKDGAVFGFDGFEQNGCAAPTPYLLIIDKAGKTVYGIDLNPCKEL